MPISPIFTDELFILNNSNHVHLVGMWLAHTCKFRIKELGVRHPL